MTESFSCRRCRKDHETLEARYADDERLLTLYMKKLPIRGWSGKMDCSEKEYAIRVSPWRRAAAERARERSIAGQGRARVAESTSQTNVVRK